PRGRRRGRARGSALARRWRGTSRLLSVVAESFAAEGETRVRASPASADAEAGLHCGLLCALVDARLEHAAGRDLRQQLVRVRFLVERLVEQILRVAEVELVGER